MSGTAVPSSRQEAGAVPVVTTRPVEESDVETIVRMVHDLAAYERSAHECRLTARQLSDALFSERPALFGHVAEIDGAVVGFVVWFLNFSTWTGTHGVYGEDMFVLPEHRRHGVGRALFREMAAECVRRGYGRLEFATLDWNEPTIAFTASLGAEPLDEWTTYRISGEALLRLGEKDGVEADPAAET
ncbi:MAG TPA: GNAT family N-acetyltransferase [Streptosporangiaceae bacterium]